MSANAKLNVDMTLNASGFTQMLNTAKTHATKFSQEVGAGMSKSWGGIGKSFVGGIVGALSFETVKGVLRGLVETAEGIKDISEQFEISTDAVQQWEHALLKANISNSVFYRSLETLRMKREEARENPEKRAAFDQIGLGDQALGFAMTDEKLLRAVLASNASRNQLRELGGPGLARLRAVTPDLGINPAMSEDVVGRISGFKSQSESWWKSIKTWVVRNLSDPRNVQLAAPIGLHREFKMIPAASEQEELVARRRREADRLSQAKEDAWESDMDLSTKELQAELKKEAADSEKLTAAQERLKEARQRNLKDVDRRAALQSELDTLDGRIRYYKDAEGALGTSDLVKLANLETRREELAGQLAKAGAGEKPSFLATDSLTKLGLITQGGMNFSTGRETIEQAQLDVLRAINSKIAVNNPWAL